MELLNSIPNIKKPSESLDPKYFQKILDRTGFLNEGHRFGKDLVASFTMEMDTGITNVRVSLSIIKLIEKNFQGSERETRLVQAKKSLDDLEEKYFKLPHPLIEEIDKVIDSQNLTEIDKQNYIRLRNILETLINIKINQFNEILINDLKY